MLGLRMVPAADRRVMEGAFAAAERAGDDPARAIVHLLGACGSPDAAVAERAGDELRRRLGAIPPARLVAMDEAVRSHLRSGTMWPDRFPLPGWVGRRDAVRWVRPGGRDALPALALLSMHPWGLVREAAVARLALHGGGDELPYLLVRVNDWAEPIHLRARAALVARLKSELAAAWVRSLPLVLRLRECGRASHEPLVQAVLHLLERRACYPAVFAGLAADDALVRRTCYARLMLGEGSNLEEVVRIGLASGDPVVRMRAARHAERLNPQAFAALMPMMLADRFTGVRAQAVLHAAKARDEAVLRRAALDASTFVRAVAAGALVEMGVDLARFYRDALLRQGGDPVLGAVAGLGERGTAEDAGIVAEYLRAPQPRVREAAVVAYARLAGTDALPALLRMIGDSNRAVSRAAMREVERRRFWPDLAELETLYGPDRPTHVRRHALRLMARRGRWGGIVAVLRAHCDGDPRVVEAAGVHLRRWMQMQRSMNVAPMEGERERFLAALDQHGGCIADTKLVAELRGFA